ncbi:hypothetical protein [Sinomonas sp. P47F7]|uniref:hypothetical protein n=1 Tax=Sinomonas sp. P47F7 TaxID=3410987 RepID=UPI003BF4762C
MKKTVGYFLSTAIAMMSAIALVAAFVGPATAAPPAPPNRGDGVVIAQPTDAQRAAALAKLDAAKKSDPAGFAQRMRMLQHADALNAFLFGDSRFDGHLQQEFVAASMPSDALEGLIEMTDAGVLKLDLSKNAAGRVVSKMSFVHHKVVLGGGIHTTAIKPADLSTLPQCPSAWAALYAWFAESTMLCELMGFFGPWSMLGCYAFFLVAGMVIDFNMSC